MMNKTRQFCISAALICATVSKAADYSVGTDSELRAAIANDGANITVTADIELSNSTLSIESNRTVTINLGGHTLNRGLTSREWNTGGQVITVRKDAKLILSNGTLTGGWGGNSGGISNEEGTVELTNVTITGCTGDDRGGGISNQGSLTMTGGSITNNTSNDSEDPKGGGGIFNYEGATATLTNVTISGNEAKVTGGGGICNFGTLTIDGCTIQNNIAKMNGGGIWMSTDASLVVSGCTITGNTAGENGGGIYGNQDFGMQGANMITDNIGKDGTANNVYLMWNERIALTAAITGSKIGVTIGGDYGTGIVSSNYHTIHTEDPSTFFTPDDDVFFDIGMNAEEEVIIKEGDPIYPVTTESQLRKALEKDNANIKLGADINLTAVLGIAENLTVTLDLNGFKLDHGCTYRNGQAIVVENGATLNLSNGTVTRGWGGDGGGLLNKGTANLTDVIISNCKADDRGGGISNHGTLTMTGGSITNNNSFDKTGPKGGGGLFNYEGATATLTGVTITGNDTKGAGGGGVCNEGMLTIDGCTITDNIAGTTGGGIWNKDTATLNIQGENAIMANMAYGSITNNVFLDNDAVITVTGSLAGSQIGVNMKSPGAFTSGFSTSGVADPTHIFLPDLPSDIMAVGSEGGEAKLYSVLPSGTVYYIERDWDDKRSRVTGTFRYLTEQIDFDATPTSESQYKLLTSSNVDALNLGTLSEEDDMRENYVVIGDVNVKGLFVKGTYVHLILCDDAKLTLGDNITLYENHHLTIHDQGYFESMGQLYGEHTSIGGIQDDSERGGEIYIDGGNINVKGHEQEAAIGGQFNDLIGNITIMGGNIRAEGGNGAAGIGSGYYNFNYGDISIYGGIVNAIGGANIFLPPDVGGGAGIGGGMYSQEGNVRIYGGYITATSNSESAGIGGSQYSDDYYSVGYFDIRGGVVLAYGGTHAAGIGGGDGVNGGHVYIRGGHVEAYGGDDAAGIGGGEGGNGWLVNISGGYVYAKGGWEYGAGIGGGQDGRAADVEITNGVVIAEAGEDETGCRAIGPGSGSDDYGSLRLDSKLMVTSERIFTAPERKNGCWYRTKVRVEPCTHPDHTFTVSGNTINDTHLEHCIYCTTTFKEEKHNFVNDVCTACGITESTTIYTASIYQPVENGTIYDENPKQHWVVDGAKFKLPTAPDIAIPDNLEFAGWLDGTDPAVLPSYNIVTDGMETLLAPGTEYTIKKNVKFYARYKMIDITLVDNASNGEIISTYNGKQVNSVTLSGRTLYRDGRWNTLCLPFDVKDFNGTPLEGATVKTLQAAAFDNGVLTMTFSGDLIDIEAGTPYMVKWNTPQAKDLSDPVFNDVTIDNTLRPETTTVALNKKVTFSGTFSPVKIDESNRQILYLGAENTLYYPNAAMTINACRAYFLLEGIEAGDLPNGAKEIKMNFGEDVVTTSIHNLQFTITTPPLGGWGAWYSLDGRKLSGKPTKKGVYILNGEKRVIK